MKSRPLLLIWLLFSLVGCAPVPSPKSSVRVEPAVYATFPILEYHLIGQPEGRWQRTPEKFLGDLDWLLKNNYYPVNLRDCENNMRDLPIGKKPVILTFDDSTIGQFRYLPTGQVDPRSAVGILLDFHEKHPKDWPLRATFFVLIETDDPLHNIFGQPEFAAKKLQQLTNWGMEVGGHTYSHDRLDRLSPEAAKKTLARSFQILSKLSGQEIVSLSLPLGKYPRDLKVLSGEFAGIKYNYRLITRVGGGFQVVPWDKVFNPFKINRIQALDSEWSIYLKRTI